MYTVFDIANWFLRNIKDITNKKLQKLVYYAYSWHLVFNNESANDLSVRLFNSKFEAWVHGAVVPELYDKYKQYGSGILPSNNDKLPPFSADEIDVLNQVVEIYGNYNGNELESINHQESPWLNARKGLTTYEPSHVIISDIDIYNCYSERL